MYLAIPVYRPFREQGDEKNKYFSIATLYSAHNTEKSNIKDSITYLVSSKYIETNNYILAE